MPCMKAGHIILKGDKSMGLKKKAIKVIGGLLVGVACDAVARKARQVEADIKTRNKEAIKGQLEAERTAYKKALDVFCGDKIELEKYILKRGLRSKGMEFSWWKVLHSLEQDFEIIKNKEIPTIDGVLTYDALNKLLAEVSREYLKAGAKGNLKDLVRE